ncbi:GldM N-terminal domain-containing protein [Flaviramulus basaltis]|uniref:GldM N-terminal domain-containing protein n=2 Tax=Flaviramulus basaltis TaxID=369401 RepID=A0A1K2IS51_9FLAO|nr:GldM N-terminal domain-containing protein [Flaviramulus basaltis]
MYGLLNEQLVEFNEILKAQISENLKKDKLTENESAKLYHTLTKEYLMYLDGIYSQLINNPKIEIPTDYEGEISKKEYSNDFFFNGEKYSENGAKFISKMENYRIEILKLVRDKNLGKRINVTLNSTDITGRNGKIKYLDYFYKDAPLISVLAHIRQKENSVIEMENDFIKNILINEK